MRKQMGLTQAIFGKLVGVSVPTVVNWEGTEGKVETLRKATLARIQSLKGKGKREVAGMLGEGRRRRSSERLGRPDSKTVW